MERLKFKFTIVIFVIFGSLYGYYLYVTKLSIPQESLLLSKNGNQMWYNSPASENYNGKLYLGYMDSQRNVIISQINNSNERIIDAHILHTYHYLDDHGAPILHIIKQGENKGKILAIYALHNSKIYSRISSQPENITSWEQETVINPCACTYPNLIEIDQTLYLFYRKEVSTEPLRRSYYMMISKNGGASWSKEKEIIQAKKEEWIYAIPHNSEDKSIHLIWGIYTKKFNEIRDVFYAKSTDLGETWNNERNNFSSHNIIKPEKYQIYSSPPKLATRIWDFTTMNNNPVYLRINFDKQQAHTYVSKRLPSGKWKTLNLGENAIAYYPCGATFYANNPHIIYTSIREQPNLKSTIVKITIASDFNSWNIAEKVINNSNDDYCRPQGIEQKSSIKTTYIGIKEYKNFMDYKTYLLGYKK